METFLIRLSWAWPLAMVVGGVLLLATGAHAPSSNRKNAGETLTREAREAWSDTLLRTVCGQESGGEPVPAWAVNRYGSAWGRCQVKYWSAVHFAEFDRRARGGRPTRSPGDLFDEQVNVVTGWQVLNDCRTRLPDAGPMRLAYCYCAGPYSAAYTSTDCRLYAKRVSGLEGNRPGGQQEAWRP